MLTTNRGFVMEDEEQIEILQKLLEIKPHMNVNYKYTEVGMAFLWIDIYGDDFLFCPQNHNWYQWDTGCWHREEFDGVVKDKLIELLQILGVYVDEVELPEDHEYRKFIHSLNTRSHIANIISIVTDSNDLWVMKQQLDTDPYILNTPNAAYDLRTGEVVEMPKEKRITMTTDTANYYEGLNVTCDRWYTFIDEIMNGDKEKAKFLQRALGYSILGDNREECMFIAYGSTTRNGKSTLFAAIQAALGHDYCNVVSPKIICEVKNGAGQDYNAAQPMLAKLVGVRVAIMSEAAKDARLDGAALKSLTGRDELMTRENYGNPFTFLPQFTLWLNTNFLPSVNDASVFASDRMWVIEFDRHFNKEEQDNDLKAKLCDPDNRPTILKWLMDGCADYMKHGLMVPDSVKDATAAYERSQDRIGRFIDERCDIVDHDHGAARGTVYAEYTQWCHSNENRYNPIGSTTFYAEMAARGYHAKKTNGEWILTGIKTKAVPAGKVRVG